MIPVDIFRYLKRQTIPVFYLQRQMNPIDIFRYLRRQTIPVFYLQRQMNPVVCILPVKMGHCLYRCTMFPSIFLSIVSKPHRGEKFPGGFCSKTDSKMCLEACFRHKDSIICLLVPIIMNVRFKNVILNRKVIFLCDSNTLFWYIIVILKFYKLYFCE